MIRPALAALALIAAPAAAQQAHHGPPAPVDPYADRDYPAAAMAQARARMMAEHGGGTFARLFFNLAEYQPRAGADGVRWDGEAWIGGDIDRLVIKSEGEGARGEGVERGSFDLLWSRAIDPYFDLQLGVRREVGRGRDRSSLAIGVEGLAPYWIETDATLYLSTKGELLAELEAWHDARITQRLILQPRAEVTLAAQDSAATRRGAGIAEAELGLRLRYEFAREFAPYVGVEYVTRTGRSADFARADGEAVATTHLVAGVRFWF